MVYFRMYGPTQTKTPTIFRTMKSPSKTYINMENLVLAIVFPREMDKNGTPMRCGKTADYIDGNGVFQPGDVITTYSEHCFDKFIVGLQIAPRA